jgi:hypothetical protein
LEIGDEGFREEAGDAAGTLRGAAEVGAPEADFVEGKRGRDARAP